MRDNKCKLIWSAYIRSNNVFFLTQVYEYTMPVFHSLNPAVIIAAAMPAFCFCMAHIYAAYSNDSGRLQHAILCKF